MSTLDTEALAEFCARCGVHGPLVAESAGTGRNSRVTRLSNAAGQWIFKEYGPGLSGHDRLGAEFAFLKYLQSGGIENVAQPIGMDRQLHCALYSLLPGERPTHATADYITQSAQFIAAVNRDRMTPQAIALAKAADACLDWCDHLTLTRARLTQLLQIVPHSPIEKQARTLVAERYAPLWQMLETTLADAATAKQTVVPILSPSDFGFHNTLVDQGRLSFVDFEYAGWDDPVKLICDFICQPELPISRMQGVQFIEQLSGVLPFIGDVAQRVELLLPVHRLKWCCILLNEFRPEHHQRRIHAGIAAEGLLVAQFNKASRYFNSHFGLNQD